MKVHQKIALILTFIISAYIYWSHREIPFGQPHDAYGNLLNAHCIRHFLVDEYGLKAPLALRSFEDFKPPALAYLLAGFSYFQNLNHESARILVMSVGFVAVLLAMFFAMHLAVQIHPRIHMAHIIIWGPALLISPWVLAMHRYVTEPSLSVLYSIILFWLILHCLIHPRSRLVYLLGVVFGFGMFVYQGTKMYAVLGMPFLVFQFWKYGRFKAINWLFAVATNCALVIGPFVQVGAAAMFQRLKTVKGLTFNPLVFIKNTYLQISPDFLFFHGPNNAIHHTGYFGLFSRGWFVFYLFGFFYLIKQVKQKDFFARAFAIAFLLSILPAAITRDEIPHAARGATSIFFVALITLMGVGELEVKFRKYLKQYSAMLPISILFISVLDLLSGIQYYFFESLHSQSERAVNARVWQHYPGHSSLEFKSESWRFHDPNTVVQRFEEATKTIDPRYCGFSTLP